MKIAYVDEAGCTGALPPATSAIQPVFVQAAVVVDQAEIRGLTLDFLRLKARSFPALGGREGTLARPRAGRGQGRRPPEAGL